MSFLLRKGVCFLILFYKSSGFLVKGGCRYYPTCSEYCLLCFEKFGFIQATKLSFKRLISCRPFNNKSLYDPIPCEEKN